ncbi:MAG TPA: hypothetical protein V6D23_13395 [Candidatus Obscuribacterales bacterium]
MRKLIPVLVAFGLAAGLIGTPVLTQQVQAVAAKTTSIQPGAAVGPVQLGAADTVLKQNPFGLKLSVSGKDTEYEGQTVYYYFYGSKDAENNYQLQVYSDVKHKVIIFEINSPAFKTPQGIGVGSAEAALVKAYGSQLKKQQRGRIYIIYTLGGRKGTDFYVKNGKVTQMLVRSY